MSPTLLHVLPLALGLLAGCARAPRVAEAPDPERGVYTDDTGRRLRYRLWMPPPDPTRPLGALLFFPWDGGGAAYARAGARRAALAARHHLVLVSLRQPEGACWWAPEVEENTRAVERFLADELIGARGVDPGRVFATGLSGGADFASAFHHNTGFAYGGGVVALCGGDVPRLDGGDCEAELSPPAAPPRPVPAGRPDLRFFFAITEEDPLLAPSREAAAFYTGLGFTEVRHQLVPGRGHCGFAEGFDGLDALAEGLAQVDPLLVPR